jgi:hypothetical protein
VRLLANQSSTVEGKCGIPSASSPEGVVGYPPFVDAFGYGPRLPWRINSPIAKSGYMFVEKRFGLPRLTTRDAHAAAPLDSVAFDQARLSPLVIPIPSGLPADDRYEPEEM